ncbi:cleavage and polyadenylation specificity factor subunit 7 isoform X4 [Ranitomeya imitator]|uniref:cleavage and polyadenylation specificity factor subunit 7 isoform X4 n=1 Tax=Ranitomeya imitator TaxID=111125 RepID=UPI0037E71572
MADGADLIDIYADEEFMQVGETRAATAKRDEADLVAEQVDLYDDVLAVASLGSSHHDGKSEPTSPVQVNAESKKTPAVLYTYKNVKKKASVYIGNFTWWTTDQQLLAAIRSVGVHDPVELKFAENRANGKSKGYAEVIVSSEASLSHVLEQLPTKKVNGKKLDVRPANRQNLSFFEAIARKTEGVPNSKDSVDPADGFFSPPELVSSPRIETPKNVIPYFTRPPFIENNSRIPLMSIPHPPMPVPPPLSSALPAVYRAPPIPPLHYSHLMPPPPRLPPPLGMPPPGGVPPALHLNPAFFPPPNSMVGPPPDPYKMISNPYLQGRKRHRSRERSPSRSREGSSRRHRDPHEDRSDDYYHDRHRDKDRHR